MAAKKEPRRPDRDIAADPTTDEDTLKHLMQHKDVAVATAALSNPNAQLADVAEYGFVVDHKNGLFAPSERTQRLAIAALRNEQWSMAVLMQTDVLRVLPSAVLRYLALFSFNLIDYVGYRFGERESDTLPGEVSSALTHAIIRAIPLAPEEVPKRVMAFSVGTPKVVPKHQSKIRLYDILTSPQHFYGGRTPSWAVDVLRWSAQTYADVWGAYLRARSDARRDPSLRIPVLEIVASWFEIPLPYREGGDE